MDDSRGWTLGEIQRMLDHARDARDRAILLTLASSGMRVGGMLLRWDDLTRMYDVGGRMVKEGDLKGEIPGEIACVAVRVYRRSSEEHVTFVTPEAYRAMIDYAVQWETEAGKKPRGNDPIFKSKNLQSMLGVGSISTIITHIASSAGVRKRQPGNPRKFEVPLMHGFRRFFAKVAKSAAADQSVLSELITTEYMMGHYGTAPNDRNYFKADVEEKAESYVKIVPSLTISESERLKHADSRNDKVRSKLDKQDDRIGQLEGMLEYLRDGEFADSG